MDRPGDYAAPVPGFAPLGGSYAAARAQGGQAPSSTFIITLIGCVILPVSLIPASRGFFANLPLLPTVWWKINLVVIFGLFVAALRPFMGYSAAVSRPARRYLLWPFLLLACWQILSLFWNNRDGYLKSYSLMQSIGMAASVSSAVWLVSGLTFAARLRVARAVVFMLAFVFLVYLGLSFLLPSYRPSAEFIDRVEGTLGFIRMFGPLGKATTLLFILIPLIGFSMGMCFMPGQSRLVWGSMTIYFLVATLATGSRGALLCLGSFIFCLMIALRSRAIWFLIPPIILVPLLLLMIGLPERFRNFEDRARFQTYATAMRAFTDSPAHILAGTGHGELYTVLYTDTERKMLQRSRWYMLTEETPYGYTLRSSHTAILRPLAETGIIGFVLFAIPMVWIIKRFIRPRLKVGRDPYGMFANCLLVGTVAVIPYMAFDEFFVNAYWIVFLWCLFVVIGTECQRDAEDNRMALAYEAARRPAYVPSVTHRPDGR